MKKNDKKIVLLILGFLFLVMTWFVATGSFQEGAFVAGEKARAGLFDYLLVIYYAVYYKTSDIFYLLVLGGSYGVLSKTKSYRKLVSKMAQALKNKEIMAMLVVTLLMGLIVSVSNQILPVLVFVPFIVTVFLKRGKDRLTAFSAAFGGIFIGLLGRLFGTYGMTQWYSTTELTVTDGIWAKVVVFAVAYLLFNLFTILHMRKQKEVVNELEYDMFATEKLDAKESKNKKLWPSVVVFVLFALITVLAYIDWNTSFNVVLFDDIYTSIENIQIGDVSVITQLLGSFNAFGKWNEALPISCVLLIVTILISLFDKVKLSEYFENFGEGLKKFGKVVVIYAFAMMIFFFSYYFDWPATFINALFGNGNLNILLLLIISLISALFYVDGDFTAYVLGSYIATNYADNLVGATLLMQFGAGLASVFVPSSAVLMIGLTYLDIPYGSWLKYIWKFLLAMFIVIILVSAVLCYA